MTVTIKQLEAEVEKYSQLPALLASCRSTIHALGAAGKRIADRNRQLELQVAQLQKEIHILRVDNWKGEQV